MKKRTSTQGLRCFIHRIIQTYSNAVSNSSSSSSALGPNRFNQVTVFSNSQFNRFRDRFGYLSNIASHSHDLDQDVHLHTNTKRRSYSRYPSQFRYQ